VGAGAAAPVRQFKLAEPIRYATSRRLAVERFLTDGLSEIDSNIVERAIRRKAKALFINKSST